MLEQTWRAVLQLVPWGLDVATTVEVGDKAAVDEAEEGRVSLDEGVDLNSGSAAEILGRVGVVILGIEPSSAYRCGSAAGNLRRTMIFRRSHSPPLGCRFA